MVRFLKNGSVSRSNYTVSITFSEIEESKGSVIRTGSEKLLVSVVEHRSTHGRMRSKCGLGSIRIIQIPNVRVDWHFLGRGLEPEGGVADGHSSVCVTVRVPSDLGNRSLGGVGILQEHHSLSRDGLGLVFRLFSREVLFEQIVNIVLLDALCCFLSSTGDGRSESKISLELSLILDNILSLSRIELSGPSSLSMLHSFILSGDPFSVDLD